MKILGLGRALPETIVSSEELEKRWNLESGTLETLNGVRERRWAKIEETNAVMGARAALEALDAAGIAKHDIDLLINASGSPQQCIPDNAPLIQKELGLDESGIPAFTVDSSCLSFLSALDTANAFLKTERYRTILIVSSEICSVALDHTDPKTAGLFGDAAAAAVVSNDDSSALLGARFETYSAGAELTRLQGLGTRYFPNSPDTKPERNWFTMDGSRVARLALRYAPDFMEKLRPGLSQGLGELKLVVPHQTSRLGLRLLRKFWAEESIEKTLPWLGNCLAASIPATLYEAAQNGRLQRGDEFLLFGTGAGLSLGGVILRY